jgi:hypothetical protein
MNGLLDRIGNAARGFARTIHPRNNHGMYFYQAIDLPGIGPVPGTWDHRGTEEAYLGRTEFSGMTVIDVGPANGFWSFEMERRGAKVTAVELGPDDKWDIVPNCEARKDLVAERRGAVESVLDQFWICHKALNSKAEVVRGSAYNVPDIIEWTEIAMMGNILQHLRDPFLAIERVAKVVTRKIIISESLWLDEESFLNSTRMHLIPRLESPLIEHSWYQVSPGFVMEVLKMLGFKNLKNEYHDQKFCGTPTDPEPRMIKHFTVSGERA